LLFLAWCPFKLNHNFQYFPELTKFWNDNSSVFIWILFILVLAIGLILEDIGSLIEQLLWSNLIKRKDEKYLNEWDQYLQLYLKDEMVGQRYLRTILVRMKFELSMAPALFIALVGFAWLSRITNIWSTISSILVSIGIGVLGLYLLWESYLGAKLLGNTRRIILEGVENRKVQIDVPD
jgi:hypothetical protein